MVKIEMSIEFLKDGFAICADSGKTEILWSDVKEIHAYKRDLITYDEIYLDIILPEIIITVSEEIKEWIAFTEKMNDVFTSINKEWYADIMLPAFETKFTILYKKD
jgi:hypothetical protein